MEDNNQKYTGQTFQNQAIYIDGKVVSNPQITVARPPYLLERYDFDKIIRYHGNLKGIAFGLLGASIGLLVNMIAKLIGSKLDPNINFDKWEVFAFLISAFLTLVFFGIDSLIPNERKRIVKKIRDHFESNHNN